ncbi:LPXTG cell wall anchor domain-containing protein [Pediococcus ethanolidurans]|uniref:MBG domain-containing protein n=1 Tax=Pediococcus ethanolidurans TaxID=319653 RepID=UPI0029545AC2|nr:MBG domain-containing protein [Pediococcus ethanolidurans]MDV7718715.1 LPXTG cell wall anchor domain-containing protein [Pediococcus ethanolidurans]
MGDYRKVSRNNKNGSFNQSSSVHYKLYKSGKLWLVTGITLATLFMGGGIAQASTVNGASSNASLNCSSENSSKKAINSSSSSENTNASSSVSDSSTSEVKSSSVSAIRTESASTNANSTISDVSSSTDENGTTTSTISNQSSASSLVDSNSTSASESNNNATTQVSETAVSSESSSSAISATEVNKTVSNSDQSQMTAKATSKVRTLSTAADTVSSGLGVTDANIGVSDDELWSDLSTMQVNLTLNYTDTVDIPKGSRIVLKFTNPSIIDWNTFAAAVVPKYLTQIIDENMGTVTLVYNNGVLNQSGQLGITYTAKVVNPGTTDHGTTYVDASLVTPNNESVNFAVPVTPITVNNLASYNISVITTYWPGGDSYGASDAATLLNNTNTPQPVDQPSVDSYGNDDDIISAGSFTNDGDTLPALIDVNLNWTSDWNSQLMQLTSADKMSNYINSDGGFNYNSSDSTESGFFAITVKVNGNLKLTADEIHLYLPETGEDVTDYYYVESLGSGVFGIMLKTDTAIGSTAALYPRTAIYLTPTVSGALATESTDGTQTPISTSSIVTNVIWYPSDAPQNYNVHNETTLIPMWSPNVYSTSFVPKITGLGDQTITSGQAITEATILRGATASDVEDGDLTSGLRILNLGGLNLNNPVAGSYTVTVEVTDNDGNITTAQATIAVRDPELATYTITEKFQDTNGNAISPDTTTSMKEGDYQEFTAPEITGYTFVSVNPSAGVIATQNETLVFTYRQNATAELNGSDDKVYDGKVGSINPAKYTLILSNGENYTLTAADLMFVETDPVAVGNYHVELSAQGLDDLNALNGNYTYSTDSINGEGTYNITPAEVTAELSGIDGKTYDGKVGTINPTKYTITLSNGESYVLTANDLQFVETNPVTVGNYHVELSAQGLTDLNTLNGNYTYTTDSISGEGTYSITSAKVTAELSGTDGKMYDGKVGTINPTKYTITLSNGENYTLTAADLQFVENSPTSVGNYHVKLSNRGLADLNEIDSNYAVGSVSGEGTYKIMPATVTAELNGTDGKTYDGKIGTINPAKYTLTLSNGEDYVLTANDLQFVETNPVAVGNYHVELSAQGLADLNEIDSNYTVSAVNGEGTYNITPAKVTAELSGTDGKTYDGNAGTINPTKYTLTLSNGENYTLTAADLQFVEDSPTNVGNYHVELSNQGLADLNALNVNYIYTTDSVNGEGTYNITPAKVTAELSGTDGKTYDGKVGTINPVKYTIILSNGESYVLTANDLQFVETNPVAVGNYHVELSAQGLDDLNTLDGNYVYTSASIIGEGIYTIKAVNSAEVIKPSNPGHFGQTNKPNKTAVTPVINKNSSQTQLKQVLINNIKGPNELKTVKIHGLKNQNSQQKGKQKLPQTNDQNQGILTLVGFAILELFGLVTFLKRKN